jgi:hypothetical protein
MKHSFDRPSLFSPSAFCAASSSHPPSLSLIPPLLPASSSPGIGFGFIYLPAIVTVGYYFESKRAFATGIAVCGSGAFILPSFSVFFPSGSVVLAIEWQRTAPCPPSLLEAAAAAVQHVVCDCCFCISALRKERI